MENRGQSPPPRRGTRRSVYDHLQAMMKPSTVAVETRPGHGTHRTPDRRLRECSSGPSLQTAPTPPPGNWSRPAYLLLLPTRRREPSGSLRTARSCEIRTRPGQTSSRLGETSGRLGETSGRLGETSGRLGETSGRLGETSGRLGETSGRLGETSGRLGETSGRLGETSARQAQPSARQAQPSARQGEISARPGETSDRPGGLAGRRSEEGCHAFAPPGDLAG